MKITAVKLDDKEYPAAKLTLVEFSEATRIIGAMQAGVRAQDVSKFGGLLRGLAEIVCSSIRRAGSNITVEEIEGIATIDQIAEAVGTLMHVDTCWRTQSAGGGTVN